MDNGNEKEVNLVDYIHSQYSLKKTKEEIIASLKAMEWSEQEINEGFFEFKERKSGKRKKVIVNISATVFIIIAVVFILLFSPKSPVKYEKTKTMQGTGEMKTYSEDIHDIIYDNETGQRKRIPVQAAESMARMKRMEQQMANQTGAST